jgi:uncharacterized RDD family membrane protein YckC
MKSRILSLLLAAASILAATQPIQAAETLPEPAASPAAPAVDVPPPAPPADLAEPAPAAPAEPIAPVFQEQARDSYGQHRDRIKVGSNLKIAANEEVNDVVVVMGNATINGRVHRDLVVVSGDAVLNGKVDGDVRVVFGTLTFGLDAEVGRDLIVVGGEIKSEGEIKVGGAQINAGVIGEFPALDAAIHWVRSGPLLGRPLTFGLGWVWVVAGVLLAFHVLAQLLFPKPVQACVASLENRPVGSLFAGVLFLLLFAPVVVLLSVSVVGIVVIPFLLCGMIVAAVLGKVAIYRFVGQQLGRQLGLSVMEAPLLALVGGTVLFYALYLVPVVGLLCWGAISVVGLGSAVAAVASGLRRETRRPQAAPPPNPQAGAGGESPFFGGAAEAVFYPTNRVGFWARTLATALDMVLIGTVVAVLHPPGPAFPFVPLVWALYHIAMWSWKGTTIGGIILGLRIVRTDGRPINFAVAFVRAVSSVFSALAFGLGFFWAGWSESKQSWHDRIAGTCVLRVADGQSLV